jgi:hypothetical protein
MEHIKGDLLEGDWDFAAHVANSHCVMGSGVAYFLRKKWPQVYQADLDFQDNLDMNDCDAVPDDKLGYFTLADVGDGRGVYNMYAMWGVGNDGDPLHRNCSYDSLFDALYRICADIIANAPYYEGMFKVGVPKYMGCARAGGEWNIVEAIIESIESKFHRIVFFVYEIDEAELRAQSSVKI